ncbi:efflux transporter outer membrane subunit [Geomonas sp. Red32]|uniref:efflux transporter outer membrane subunit n=1 Tax=Geomonas sp. Red32 TaxID=2912856 RepID=UPI00202CE5A8|nr:efflux transporter outer membrane subunit [Geomonas sp. Red32]MCM0082913.1 efflux transporter outer membrane subunit [Geomonas sp. Red32]
MTRKFLRGGLLLAAVLSFSGCASMAPKYSKPEAPVPTTWPAGPAYKGTSPNGVVLSDLAWKDFFVDGNLRKIIDLALANNRDLRTAALNIERAQALYQVQRSGQFPAVNGVASYQAQRTPGSLTNSGNAVTSQVWTLGLGVSSYELDFFGRIQSLKDQALDQYLSTEQARRAVQISLVAEVANDYLNYAADKERLKIAQETLVAQVDSYKITKSRFDLGVATGLDLARAATTVESARVDVARYTGQIATDLNALQLVVGAPVAPELLPPGLNEVTVLKEISAGVPSEVLTRRPDILAAENVLKGANANIGAARAAFFPRITLTGTGGLASDSLSGLFTGGAGAWQFLPQISVPIFNAGLNKANLKIAEVDRDISVNQYERTIQVAFREVSDALAQYGTIGDQLTAQQALVNSSTVSYQLSETRYQGGVDNYLSVLDAERSMYSAEQGLVSLRLSRLSNLVTLYKVLGGGA